MNAKEHKITTQQSSKFSTNVIPKPERFPPTEELHKYKQLMEILKPYHNPKKRYTYCCRYFSTLEQTRDLMQNIAFDTTRVSQSASCIHTSLDEINYTFEKLQQF